MRSVSVQDASPPGDREVRHLLDKGKVYPTVLGKGSTSLSPALVWWMGVSPVVILVAVGEAWGSRT